jgi:hypothetical protein
MFIQTQLEIYRNTDATFNLVVRLNGTPTNITGATLKFIAKWNPTDPDENAVVSFSGAPNFTIIGAAGGVATMHIPASATFSLPNEVQKAEYAIGMMLDAKSHIIAHGPLIIHPNLFD